MSLSRQVVRGLAFLAAAGTLAACGSDSATSPGTKNTLTSAEAQQVAVALFTEIDRAWATATVTTAKASQGPSASFSMVPTTINETINSTCSAGGTIKGSVSGTFDTDAAGAGTESVTMSVTTAGCKLNTGQQIIAVDGSLTYGFTVAFTNGAQSSDFVWTGKGSFNWSGGSCVIDYTVRYTATGHGSETGTFCGSNINYTF